LPTDFVTKPARNGRRGSSRFYWVLCNQPGSGDPMLETNNVGYECLRLNWITSGVGFRPSLDFFASHFIRPALAASLPAKVSAAW
jgi:hypothetical protein